jgi:hypothetical protein
MIAMYKQCNQLEFVMKKIQFGFICNLKKYATFKENVQHSMISVI